MKDKIILAVVAGVTVLGGIVATALLISNTKANKERMELDKATEELDRSTEESIDRVTEIIVKEVGVDALDQCKNEIVRSYIKSIAKNDSRILTIEEQKIVEDEITKSIDRMKQKYKAI